MNKLDNYISTLPTKNINKLQLLEEFNDDDVLDDLEFLVDTIYTDYKITKDKLIRDGQQIFRDELINKYGCCIVTGETCLATLEACHIIPLCKSKNYDIDNGLLLRSDLHKTFDHHYWSINPLTLKVVINNNIHDVGEIKNYENYKINIQLNDKLIKNIENNFNNFLKHI